MVDDYEDLSDHKEGIGHDQHDCEGEELHQPLVYNLKALSHTNIIIESTQHLIRGS
jgi:hypothetical protein